MTALGIEFGRLVGALALLQAAFALSGYAQEAAPESAGDQRERRRWIAPPFPLIVLTNRDIGDLHSVQRSEPPPVFSGWTWQSLLYSDNVFRTREDRRESLGWSGDVGVTIVPYATGRWTPWISGDYFRFRYNREPTQDFDGQSLTVGSRLNVSDDRPMIWDLAYSLWRFVDGHHRSDEFFKEGLLENHFTWMHSLTSQPLIYSEIAYGVAFRHASPSKFDRLENEIILGLHYFLWKHLRLSGYARPALRQYLTDEAGQGHRNDLHLESGLIVGWNWTRNFSARGEIAWTWNDSNRSNEDYYVMEPQLSVFVQLAF